MLINKLRIMNRDIIFPELSYKITGILFSVHNELGRYCNEKQYGDYLEKKFKDSGMEFEREKLLPISFEGENPNRNRIDFLMEGKITLELKCKRVIERIDFYQVKRYLIAFNKKLGILVNFRSKYLQPKRIINS